MEAPPLLRPMAYLDAIAANCLATIAAVSATESAPFNGSALPCELQHMLNSHPWL